MREKTLHFTLLLIATSLLFACSKEVPPIEENKNAVEQTDLKFEGALEFTDIQTSMQSDNTLDIVTFAMDNSFPKRLTFKINLDNNNVLAVTIYHRHLDNVWESPTNYPIYATKDSSEHWKYCEAYYQVSTEAPSYYTHWGNALPKGTDIDAFEVISYNPTNKEIRCRFRDMVLYRNAAGNDKVTINGTFVSAANF